MSQYDAKQAVAVADARDAVIEAAKAWRERMLKYAVCEQEYTLMAAVEALQEVEGE